MPTGGSASAYLAQRAWTLPNALGVRPKSQKPSLIAAELRSMTGLEGRHGRGWRLLGRPSSLRQARSRRRIPTAYAHMESTYAGVVAPARPSYHRAMVARWLVALVLGLVL